MNMRAKKRAALAMWTPPADPNEADVLATLTQARLARVELLRTPGALQQVKNTIKRMKGPSIRVMRKMLAEDLKLMRRLDRQAQP